MIAGAAAVLYTVVVLYLVPESEPKTGDNGTVDTEFEEVQNEQPGKGPLATE